MNVSNGELYIYIKLEMKWDISEENVNEIHVMGVYFLKHAPESTNVEAFILVKSKI